MKKAEFSSSLPKSAFRIMLNLYLRIYDKIKRESLLRAQVEKESSKNHWNTILVEFTNSILEIYVLYYFDVMLFIGR